MLTGTDGGPYSSRNVSLGDSCRSPSRLKGFLSWLPGHFPNSSRLQRQFETVVGVSVRDGGHGVYSCHLETPYSAHKHSVSVPLPPQTQVQRDRGVTLYCLLPSPTTAVRVRYWCSLTLWDSVDQFDPMMRLPSPSSFLFTTSDLCPGVGRSTFLRLTGSTTTSNRARVPVVCSGERPGSGRNYVGVISHGSADPGWRFPVSRKTTGSGVEVSVALFF